MLGSLNATTVDQAATSLKLNRDLKMNHIVIAITVILVITADAVSPYGLRSHGYPRDELKNEMKSKNFNSCCKLYLFGIRHKSC